MRLSQGLPILGPWWLWDARHSFPHGLSLCSFHSCIPLRIVYSHSNHINLLQFVADIQRFLSLPNALSDSIVFRVLQVGLSRHSSYNSIFHLREILSPSELCLPCQYCSFSVQSPHPFQQAHLVQPNGSHRRSQPQSYLSR